MVCHDNDGSIYVYCFMVLGSSKLSASPFKIRFISNDKEIDRLEVLLESVKLVRRFYGGPRW